MMPSAPLREFLLTLGELDASEFFLMHRERLVLVCSDGMRQSLAELYQLGAVPHEDPEAASVRSRCSWDPNALFLIAVLDGREEELRSRFERHFPGRVIGLIRDVCLPRMCGLASLSSIDLPYISPAVCYAIVCTPRSGSTYLSSLLSKLPGGGAPREHLRSPALYFARHRAALGFDVARWVDALVNAQTRDGVFGTKIISHFLTDLLEYLSPEDLRRMESRLPSPKIVHLVRRNKYEQAVSGFFAKQTAKWHIWSVEEVESHRRTRRQVNYDFDLIRWQYERYVRMEVELGLLLDRTRLERLTIYYEDLLEDPRRRIGDILHFLRCDSQRTVEFPQSDVARISDELSEEFVVRFRRDLASRTMR